METRKGWGMVVWSSIFALAIIAVAGITYYYENGGAIPFLSGSHQKNADDEDGDGLLTWEELAWHTDPKKADTDGDGASDGAEVVAGTNPTILGAGENPYEAWGGSTPSDSFAQDIRNLQLAYQSSTTAPLDFKAETKNTVARVQVPNLTENIPITALRISTSTDYTLYGQIVYGLLQKSFDVRKDELAIFKKTIDSRNHIGTPELKAAAGTYKAIEAALLAVPVPQAAAQAHIALVNSIGSLANIVSAMGAWGGDPLAGIAYIDAFLKIGPQVQNDITILFTVISNLINK